MATEGMNLVTGITHIPIFPLPVVLMPFELLPLHIFEPRYLKMLDDISGQKNFFGINFIEEEKLSLPTNRPEPGSIGCVAQIRQVMPAANNTVNIMTVGIVRYMITEYEDSANKPYHYARIEFFEDAEDDSVGTIAAEVRELFRRIAHAAFKLSGNRGALPDIPAAEPEQLSFLVAAALELKSSEKLEMISLTSTARRLTKLKVHLEKNVKKMEESAEIVIAAEKNGHAKKPLPPIG